MTRTVIAGGQVFDGTGSPLAAGDVAIEGGRIVAVGLGLDGDVMVDAAGATLTPGLFDCHTHVMISHIDLMKQLNTPFSLPFFEAIGNLRATVDCGITSVRDAGGADLGVAEAVRRGLVTGPRMQISISPLSQTGGHVDGWMVCGVSLDVAYPGYPSGIVDGPDAVRKKIRELVRAGADVIKVCTSGGVLSPRDDPRHGHFRDDEVAMMVTEAAAAGLHVMSHAQGADGIKTAVRNGVRSIEHGIYLDDEAIAMMLDRGTWLVPTLVAPRSVLAFADQGGVLLPEVLDKARMVLDTHTENVTRAIAAGVKVAMGTDSGVGPHGTNLEELRLLVECGMPPLQALYAATGSAAALCSVAHERGTIEVGKQADLTLFAGDPVELIPKGGNALRDTVRQVWIGGRTVVGGPGRIAMTSLGFAGAVLDVAVTDLDIAESFYTTVIGRAADLELRADQREWRLCAAPEIALRVSVDPIAAGNRPLAIGVNDLAAERTRLASHLGDIPAVEVTPGVIAVLRLTDPDGNRVTLWQDLLAR